MTSTAWRADRRRLRSTPAAPVCASRAGGGVFWVGARILAARQTRRCLSASPSMRRRDFLTHTSLMLTASGAAGAAMQAPAAPVNGAASASPAAPCHSAGPMISTADTMVPLPLIRAQTDRIIALTVCTRPFRAGGARIETERLGRKTIVHNYGHGGSGWSLSWGSGTLAVRKVLETRASEIAVIGCGVIGLTSALLAQRAGLKVRIYAKERPPDTRSTFATGNWSPNSRYCSAEGATP